MYVKLINLFMTNIFFQISNFERSIEKVRRVLFLKAKVLFEFNLNTCSAECSISDMN